MKIKDFVDTDFRAFSMDDNARSLPSVIDGLKEVQRKVIFGMIDRGESAGLIKVAQAVGHIAKVSDYHHGEKSMEETIVKLAQDFIGSNNLNLLIPEGQFGSRLSPESSAPRYIYTKLSDNFRKVYKKDDDIILTHKLSDGDKIEPNFYLPILPMILINGGSGIGTGFAYKVMQYNPKQIAKIMIKYLETGKTQTGLLPWFDGFKGNITRDENTVITTGLYEIKNTTTMKITELPVGMYLDKYKLHLNQLEDRGIIKSYDDNSTEESFDFDIVIPRNTSKMSDQKIMSTFKLISKFPENYTFWTENNKIKVFENPIEIIKYFTDFRIRKYEERRLALIEQLKGRKDWLNEKQKFIKYYLKDPVGFSKKSKVKLHEDMTKEGFTEIDKLLRQPIYSLTKEEIAKLMKSIKSVQEEINRLAKTTAKDMFIAELGELKF
jgi:DNA topoisomerase-2